MNKTLIKDATGREYNVVNGTAYHVETPEAVIKWLETSRERGQRIRVFYGNTTTGRSWMDEHDVQGHVGRSTGSVKISLLIANNRSHGGGAILDDCIVRITTKDSAGRITDVYKHPKFHVPALTIVSTTMDDYPAEVHDDKGPFARFKSNEAATRWIEFINGKRNAR